MTRIPAAAFRMTNGAVGYDGTPALREVDIQIHPGEVVAVLGANGSGKSTLVRALLGLVPLSGGHVEIYGIPPQHFPDWTRIGYVPQRLTAGGGVPATVREIVASGRIARNRWLSLPGPRTKADRRAVRHALEATGLTDLGGRAVATLSGGQQQRVLIARALAGEPDTFVLDEPTAGIDAGSQHALADTLRKLVHPGEPEQRPRGERGRQDGQHTVVLVAHELGPLEPLVTRTVRLADGRIVWDGPPGTGGSHPGAEADHDHNHGHAQQHAAHAGGTDPLRAWGHHQ